MVCIWSRSEIVTNALPHRTDSITMMVPITRGIFARSIHTTRRLSVYAMMIPSRSGMKNFSAHCNANTTAIVATMVNAKLRAPIGALSAS